MTITANSTAVYANTGALLASAKDALRAVAKRSVVPVMAGLRLESPEPGVLSVAGFDYTISVVKRVPVSAGVLNTCVVPGAAFRDALARLDAKQPVSLAQEDGKLLLLQGAKRVQLKLLSVDDYPNLPEIDAPSDLITSGEALKLIADSVAPFVGRDDMLPVLMSVQMEYADNTLSAMSTDRFRAAVMDVPVIGERKDEAAGLVPDITTVGAVFAADESVSVVLNAPGEFARFESDSTTVTTRLIEGAFPKIRHLFSSEIVTRTSVEPDGFLRSLKFVAAGVVRNESVSVTIAEGKVTMSSSDGDDLAMSDEVVAAVTGPDQLTAFNPKHLTDAVKVWGKGHMVNIGTVTGSKPSLFTSDAIPGLKVLVMPRRQA